MRRHLLRSRDDRVLAGVAGGLAELWDVDPWLVRILWLILIPFTGGFAILAYIVMAFVVPDEDDEPAFYGGAGAGTSQSQAPAPAPDGGSSTGAAGATAATGPAGAPDQPASQPATVSGASSGPSAGTPGGPANELGHSRREARAARRAARRARWGGPGGSGVVIGAILVVAGIYFLVREYIPDFDVNWLWPSALIALGVVVLLSAFRRPPGDSTGRGGMR